jgi:2-methylcitrate dehydratase PrpD
LKPYPACRMTHALIELAGNVHTDYAAKHGKPVTPADLDKITLSIPTSNFILVGDPTPNKIYPKNVVDAQFSAYFQVANALLHGSPSGLQGYKRLQDPAIHELCGKTTVVPDEKVRGFPGRIRILWKNGEEEERYQEFALGEVQHPFTRTRVEEKYFALVSPTMGESRARQILSIVDDMESSSVKDLIVLLR